MSENSENTENIDTTGDGAQKTFQEIRQAELDKLDALYSDARRHGEYGTALRALETRAQILGLFRS